MSAPGPEIMALQERIAYLERHVESLDDVVRELADRLHAAERESARLRGEFSGRLEDLGERLAGGGAAGPAGSGDDPGAGAPPGFGDAASDDPSAHLPPHWGRRPGG